MLVWKLFELFGPWWNRKISTTWNGSKPIFISTQNSDICGVNYINVQLKDQTSQKLIFYFAFIFLGTIFFPCCIVSRLHLSWVSKFPSWQSRLFHRWNCHAGSPTWDFSAKAHLGHKTRRHWGEWSTSPAKQGWSTIPTMEEEIAENKTRWFFNDCTDSVHKLRIPWSPVTILWEFWHSPNGKQTKNNIWAKTMKITSKSTFGLLKVKIKHYKS